MSFTSAPPIPVSTRRATLEAAGFMVDGSVRSDQFCGQRFHGRGEIAGKLNNAPAGLSSLIFGAPKGLKGVLPVGMSFLASRRATSTHGLIYKGNP